MSSYSIKDIEQLSGIKAHTLRIWEQRYEILQPKRTDSNIRYYDDEDLKFILNISLLNKNGYKISKIAKMPVSELKEEVVKLTEKTTIYEDKIQALTICMLDLDEPKFEKIISTSILQDGFENAMLNLVYPFLHRIGILWQTGTISPAQEHFISYLIRQKLIVAIDGQVVSADPKAKKFMLFLPEGEWHEMSLLFANYLIRKRGQKVAYLGQTLPFEDLKQAYDIYQPDVLLCVITSTPSYEYIQKYLYRIGEEFDDAVILVTGGQLIGQGFDLTENMQQLNKIEDLMSFLDEYA